MSTALSAPQQLPAAPSQEHDPDWKRQLAERLDAYRAKHPESISPPSDQEDSLADSRASRIARSVASRYAAAPSYKELMLAAAQAEQAAEEAQAALAERIASDARAAERMAQEEMVQEQIAAHEREAGDAGSISHDPLQLSPGKTGQNETPSPAGAEQAFAERYGSSICTQPGTPVMPQFAARTREMHLHQAAPEPEPTLEDLWASALVEPRALLPSKLIEFPRELVSSRRARPRLPEDPSRDQNSPVPQPEPAQLRIFEVRPDAELDETAGTAAEPQAGIPAAAPEANIHPISIEASAEKKFENAADNLFSNPTHPSLQGSSPAASGKVEGAVMNRIGIAGPAGTARPTSRVHEPPTGRESNASPTRAFKSLNWAAISLDKEPAVSSRTRETSVTDCVPFLVDPASIDRRLMAFAVDFSAVTAGFLAFLLVFAASTPHLPTGLTAAALAAAVYAALWVLYQMLFFSLSGATAGMLYARIALCTFDDQNPTRPALRRRLAAWWLSCLPLGMGFLWCFVDEDNLSWHDRMTHMYQRGY